MTAPSDRRGFLRGLVTLPLIGGGVTLIGQPTAVAEPVSHTLMESYKTWLHFEHKAVCWEMAGWPADWPNLGDPSKERIERFRLTKRSHWHTTPAGNYHSFDERNPPSDRAALVLSAVGCGWREAI